MESDDIYKVICGNCERLGQHEIFGFQYGLLSKVGQIDFLCTQCGEITSIKLKDNGHIVIKQL